MLIFGGSHDKLSTAYLEAAVSFHSFHANRESPLGLGGKVVEMASEYILSLLLSPSLLFFILEKGR